MTRTTSTHRSLPLLQILACVNVHPLISSAVEAAKEDLYEVLEEVNLPTINLAMRSDHQLTILGQFLGHFCIALCDIVTFHGR